MKKIKQQIEQAAQSQLRTKKELLVKFLEEEVPQFAQQANIDILSEFNQFVQEQKEQQFKKMSQKVDVPVESLKYQLDEYKFRGECDSRSITRELSGLSLIEKNRKKEQIMIFIKEIGDYYKALD
ncbi:type I restriction endonuclease subunit R, EcoR124 family [Holzapfeliella floricola]|uniref:type I restriction endonuclease subunit R, EcoR124 family n=1 Tax=Holzapfeliella floricola TaxID=679249 RepID=UPI000AB03F08|nr:hypothetical protein [Holzapfeliella floricola]